MDDVADSRARFLNQSHAAVIRRMEDKMKVMQAQVNKMEAKTEQLMKALGQQVVDHYDKVHTLQQAMADMRVDIGESKDQILQRDFERKEEPQE